jgi:hypothetical protein
MGGEISDRQSRDVLGVLKVQGDRLTPHLPFLDAFSPREAQRALDYIETYCPGLRDEVQGAADGFGVPVEEIAFLGGKSKEDGSSPIPVGGAHCSQFAVLPSATQDGHLYAAQNTEGYWIAAATSTMPCAPWRAYRLPGARTSSCRIAAGRRR